MDGIFNRILVALSGTPSSQAAAELALRMAQLHGSQVILVTVLDTGLAHEISRVLGRPEEEVLAEMETSSQGNLHYGQVMARRVGVPVETALRRGNPYLEIVAEAEERNVDLVVVGSSSHVGGARRLAIGRVVERVIENSDCPVLVVRHRPGEETAAEG
ncbi:MAG: universal stress protein [Chloroflexota bacterium]